MLKSSPLKLPALPDSTVKESREQNQYANALIRQFAN